MRLNTFIAAVIGIVSFTLAVFPSDSLYFEVPMGIIGKVYANSMLVLINSRMVLGSEETQPPSTARGFQNLNPTPGVEFFISQDFTEPTTHVIQAHFYIW
jgi:hypothetical protein